MYITPGMIVLGQSYLALLRCIVLIGAYVDFCNGKNIDGV